MALPIVTQYREIRKQLPEKAFLFLRLGDFYEAFDDDAVRFTKLRPGYILTHRHDIPMAGVVYHMINKEVEALRAEGFKVGIIETMEKQAPGKVVCRELVEFA